MYCKHNFYRDLNQEDVFSAVFQQEGKIYRQIKRRKTLRFTLNKKHYFAKLFWGISLTECIKNLIKGQWPVVDASHERWALEKLRAAGVHVPAVVAYDACGLNPLTRQSFIVMEAIEPSMSLEDYLHHWADKPLAMRRALIKKVAQLARMIHAAGIQHRDFYICHFLLQLPCAEEKLTPANIDLSVIDWHRARFAKSLPLSWLVKDLAALYFSVLSAPLTQRDFYRFLRAYTQQPLRPVLANAFWQKVEDKALKLYQKTYSTLPTLFRLQAQQSTVGDFYIQKNRHKVLIVRKEATTPELMHFLGDPDSIFTRAEATIIAENKLSTSVRIKVRDRDVVIKRYRWRRGWSGFSRLFRPTRAARCWHFAHRLLEEGVLTPKPLALVEKRWGWLRRDSYYVTEYCAGPSLYEFMQTQADPQVLKNIWEQWQVMQQRLTKAHLSHGDTNHQNFLMTDKGLMLLDLDTMRRHFFTHRLTRKKDRDYQRFLRGWKQV